MKRSELLADLEHKLLVNFQLKVCRENERERICKKSYCHSSEEESWVMSGYDLACEEFQSSIKEVFADFY